MLNVTYAPVFRENGHNREQVGCFIPELYELVITGNQLKCKSKSNEISPVNLATLYTNDVNIIRDTLENEYRYRLVNGLNLPDFVSKIWLAASYSDILHKEGLVLGNALTESPNTVQLKLNITLLEKMQHFKWAAYISSFGMAKKFDEYAYKGISNEQSLSSLTLEQLKAVKSGMESANSWQDWGRHICDINATKHYACYRGGMRLKKENSSICDKVLEIIADKKSKKMS